MAEQILLPVEQWAARLIERMQPGERKRLSLGIARELRKTNAQNIRAQQAPDGTPFEPRKPQKTLRGQRGKIRRQAAMFRKLRNSKNIQARATADSAFLEVANKSQRIARVHQFGLTDKVNERGDTYQYPARPLLGISPDDEQTIKQAVIDHITR